MEGAGEIVVELEGLGDGGIDNVAFAVGVWDGWDEILGGKDGRSEIVGGSDVVGGRLLVVFDTVGEGEIVGELDGWSGLSLLLAVANPKIKNSVIQNNFKDIFSFLQKLKPCEREGFIVWLSLAYNLMNC